MSSTTLNNLIHKANALIANNNLNEAMTAYNKICKIDKKNPSVWLALGSLAGNIGKFEEAEVAFQKAVNLQNRNAKAVELLAQAQEALGKNDKALETLLSYSSSGGGDNDLLLRIAILHGKTGAFHESIRGLKIYIEQNQINPDAYHCLASAYHAIDDLDNADINYKQAIKLSPGSFILHNSYGAMLQNQGMLDTALQHYQKAIGYNRKYPLALFNIATVYFAQDKYAQALEYYNAALSLKPDYLEAIIGMGKCYFAIGDKLHAIDYLKNAIKLDGNNAETLALLGRCQMSAGDFEAAYNSLSKADALDPERIEIKCSMVQLHEKRGDLEQAEKILHPLLAKHPEHKDVVIAYSFICKHMNQCERALEHINQCLTDETLTPSNQSLLHFKAGKFCDQMHDYNNAFEHYKNANNMYPYPYDESVIKQSLDNVLSLFSVEAMRTLPKSSESSSAPIFILGMPRSGTTLVEKIISSHPQVRGGGELPFLPDISAKLGGAFVTGEHDIKEFSVINTKILNGLAEEYLRCVTEKNTNETYVTDKMPHNFRLIGLINLLFPKAKIIHCIRNPIDNCLSIFFSNFNQLHPYACDLLDTARYYTDYYQALMAHWYKASSIEIYDVIYEDLIDNQEKISRSILEHCGIDWDDTCFDFHKSDYKPATISYDQVRQPIYKTSKQRWKNYSNHISPLLQYFDKYVT